MIKENSAASFFDVLRNRAVEIVKPDLDIPGTTAIACAIPIINALNRLIGVLPSEMKLVVSKIIPVIINIIATEGSPYIFVLYVCKGENDRPTDRSNAVMSRSVRYPISAWGGKR